MSDVTKEGVKVEAGQVWRDLDQTNRTVTVESVDGGFAYVRSSPNSMGRQTRSRISIKRMHNHGTGFALVSPAALKE